MKYTALLAVDYLYSQNQSSDVNISSYQALLAKWKVHRFLLWKCELAEFFCNDVTLQTLGGSSVKSCLDNYQRNKSKCDSKLFSNLQESYATKAQVAGLVKRYTRCVGVTNESLTYLCLHTAFLQRFLVNYS